MGAGIEYESLPPVGVEPAVEQPSRAAELARELRALPAPHPTGGLEHQSPEILHQDYQGDLPPIYTGDVPTWDAPVTTAPEVEEMTKDAWYDEPPEVDRFPLDNTQIASTEESQFGSAAPQSVEEPSEKQVETIQTELQPFISETDRQAIENAQRNALTVLDSIGRDMSGKVDGILELKDILRQDRRSVILKYGREFIATIEADPAFREYSQLKDRMTERVRELCVRYNQEPTQNEEGSIRLQADNTKKGTNEVLGRIRADVEKGDLSVPLTEEWIVEARLDAVSNLLNRTIALDDSSRGQYIKVIDNLLHELDPHGDPADLNSYSESGRVLAKMISRLQSKEDAVINPKSFQEDWAESVKIHKAEYSRRAKQWAETMPDASTDKVVA